MTLREQRLYRGLTQHRVAAVLGITQGYYCGLEVGKYPITPHLRASLKLWFDWDVAEVQPRTGGSKKRVNITHLPNPDAERMARLMAMMALCVYDGPIPRNWRWNIALHRKAIREYMAQIREGRRDGRRAA